MSGSSAAPLKNPARVAALCCCVPLLFSGAVRAQGEDELPTTGVESLDKEWRQHRELAAELLKGNRPADPRDPQHVEALDVTYCFTWVARQRTPGEMGKLFQQGIESDVLYLTKGKPNTSSAIQIYSEKVIAHALEVLKTQRLIARLNAARVLAKLAELGPTGLAEALVPVLEDPGQSDAVKFFAARGLRELAAQQPPVIKPEVERQAVETLASFVDRNLAITDATTDEERTAFVYVRREAIRALAQFRNPGAAEKGHGAFTLLRVVAKDGFVPPPRIDERVEAAIGIARMRPSLDKEYNQDYAAAQLALFLDDFAQGQTRERQQQPDPRAPLAFPWRVMAARLHDAVDQMRKEAGDNTYVANLAAACGALLSQAERGATADPDAVVRSVTDKPPPSGRLFKNIEESRVKPANRREDEAPPAAAPALETKPAVK